MERFALRCSMFAHYALVVAMFFHVSNSARADDGKATATQDSAKVNISAPMVDKLGWRVHTIESPYQAGTTKVSLLLPDQLDSKQKHRVLYVLPVEAGDGTRWGNSLEEVKRLDLANKHRLICVCPTFSHVPWYADHPTDAKIRQESYLLNVVVPFVEREYPALPEPRGRLLVGFSKSGSGAFSLLLRHPETFGKAAAWDSPFDTEKIDRFQIGQIFGTQENFEKYRIAALLRTQATQLRDESRLVLAGANAFEKEHKSAHDLMTELGVRHAYYDGARHKHAWDSGWLPKAVEPLTAEE